MINVKSLGDSLDLRSYARLLETRHPFFDQLKALVDDKDFFNVKITAAVDDKLKCSINALNDNRRSLLNLTTDEMLSNTNYVSLLNSFKIRSLLSPLGHRSVPYFMIFRRNPNLSATQLTAREFDSVTRYTKYPQLSEAIKALILNPVNTQGSFHINKIYAGRDKALVNVCTLSSKSLRATQRSDEESMICIYKIGLVLAPGELISWTKRIRKLTSTRHKNVLLRVAHGDVFSNSRLHRFGLKDTAMCFNCQEPVETPLHRIIECPKAQISWQLLDELKIRIGLNQLSDHSIENILGAKDKIDKIELALQSELLLRLISTGEEYDPKRLILASLKVIAHSEKLVPDLKTRIFNEITRIQA